MHTNIIPEEHRLVCTNPYTVSFVFQNSQNKALLSLCDQLLENACKCIENHTQNDKDIKFDALMQHMSILKEDIQNNIDRIPRNIQSYLLDCTQDIKRDSLSNMNELYKRQSLTDCEIATGLKRIKEDLEIIYQSCSQTSVQTHQAETISNTLQQTVPKLLKHEICEELCQMSNSIQAIERTVNPISSLLSNAKTKGSAAEIVMSEKLQEKFKQADGYDVTRTNGNARSGDITIDHNDYCSILVEVKCYSNKVPPVEVRKFTRDLESTNKHGIFVSLTSSISGINHFEIQQLASSRFAVFLCKNEYNMEEIESAVKIIHRLETLLKCKTNDNGEEEFAVKLTSDQIYALQRIVSEQVSKLEDVKHHLKQACRSIEEMSLKRIMEILTKVISPN